MNAVIIEPGGSWTLRGHHWAAEYLDLMLLNGPDEVLVELRRWEERDWWYDEDFAEGGVLADVGHRELAFFGGHELVRTIPMRRRYLDVIGAAWAGWRVRWAWRGIADILGAIGLAEEPAGGGALPPVQWDGTGGVTRPYLDVYDHVLSVRDAAGTLRLHRAPHRAVPAVLAAGPAVLGTTGPGRARLTRPGPAAWGDGAHVDLGTHTLVYWSIDGAWQAPGLARAWRGWQLRFDEDRYENQVAACGGALVMPEPPLSQVIAEMTRSAGRLMLAPGACELIKSAPRR